MKALIPIELIEKKILLFRGHKVMLDSDLAVLYGVTTKRLNERMRRNPRRFPSDFMFQLTSEEAESLRSQSATSKTGRGGRRYPPYVFTEQGVAMTFKERLPRLHPEPRKDNSGGNEKTSDRF